MSGPSYDWRSFPRGARIAFSVPGVVMCASFLGFGALVRGLDSGLLPGLLTTFFVWALPGQVVLLNMHAQGAALLAIAAAVTLTAVRLLPMVTLVISTIRVEGAPRWPLYVLAHFIAVTIWRIAEEEMETVPHPQRMPWLLGVGMTLMAGMLVMTAAGYHLAQLLPPVLAGSLIFMTPSFFFISLFGSARMSIDYLAIALGAVIGPAVYWYYPDLDLLVGGLVGGTLAYVIPKMHKGLK